MAVKRKTADKKTATKTKRAYMTQAEKESMRKSFFALEKKLKNQMEKLGPGYDKSYLVGAFSKLHDAYITFSNIW